MRLWIFVFALVFTALFGFNPELNGTVAWQVADTLRATH